MKRIFISLLVLVTGTVFAASNKPCRFSLMNPSVTQVSIENGQLIFNWSATGDETGDYMNGMVVTLALYDSDIDYDSAQYSAQYSQIRHSFMYTGINSDETPELTREFNSSDNLTDFSVNFDFIYNHKEKNSNVDTKYWFDYQQIYVKSYGTWDEGNHRYYLKNDTYIVFIQGYDCRSNKYSNTIYTVFTVDSNNVDLAHKVKVTCDTAEGCITYADKGNGYYHNGTELTYTAVPNPGYRFVQWSDSVTDNPRTIIVSQDTLITAIFERLYAINFVDYNDTLISSQEYTYGVMPTIPADPARPRDNKYVYTFAGWTPQVVAATDDATYKATYDSLYDPIYSIKFVDYNDTLFLSQIYRPGETPVPPTDPVRPKTAQYTYTFTGWSPQVVAVTEDATYKATYDSVVNKYLITFMSEDTVLSADSLEYGVMPVYNGWPTKAEDELYTYTFYGWVPTRVHVVADATYVAYFTAHSKSEAVENVFDCPSERPVKFLNNGQIYILMPDGTKYTLLGEAIK